MNKYLTNIYNWIYNKADAFFYFCFRQHLNDEKWIWTSGPPDSYLNNQYILPQGLRQLMKDQCSPDEEIAKKAATKIRNIIKGESTLQN